MYEAIFLILFGAGIFLTIRGFAKKRSPLIYSGVFILIFTILFIWLLDFTAEMLWFENLGYGQRFWMVELSQAGFAALFFVIGSVYIYLLTFSATGRYMAPRLAAMAFGAVIGGIWGYANWENMLKFWNSVSTGVVDPLLGVDTGFYLFNLPLLQSLQGLLTTLTVISILTSLIPALVVIHPGGGMVFRTMESIELMRSKNYKSFYASSALFFIILAAGKYLDRFNLLYSEMGAAAGPGWTDTNIKYPALNIIMALTAVAGIVILAPGIRRAVQNLLWRWRVTNHPAPPLVVLTIAIFLFSLWFVGLTAIPELFQWLRVEPNEITFERPYILNNIRFTRYGFKLDEVEEREFPATDNFTPQTVDNNREIFNNIRLWDHKALDEVYAQFQEIRLYYEFNDVDVDRYTVDGNLQQVMVSARELDQRNLPEHSQAFVNQRFIYTHGFGLTMANVNSFSRQGLPNLLIRDIPPRSAHPSLEVQQPRIYYGELTNNHVVVNTRQREFDYPSGEENVYNNYDGTGGVPLSNIWRKFVYGYKFDGTKLFVSSYPTRESRVMFHRNIMDRVQNLAPFLRFDRDPYVVLADKKLYWMIDAYTVSNHYPYSEKFGGINYLRNSVKIVIDAYNGTVDFYIFDEEDAIIQVWSKIFKDMFKTRDQMPESLLNHIRYPLQMLEIQGAVYAKYHMTDPTVFYNQEDLWIRATEKYYGNAQPIPVEPYYIIWQMEGSDEPEFVLMMPFTPKNRQVLVGWIAGMCDPDNYGRFLAYQFPKDRQVLGPQQVETKIDQDSYLSGQLALWDQRGSKVLRGNVLAIPVEETIIYVEPIYLQAETAAYPELRLVTVMHGDDLSYAPTFEEALRGIFGEQDAVVRAEEEKEQKEQAPASPGFEDLVQAANSAFEDYIRHTGDKNFDQASQALSTLERVLKQLAEERVERPEE